MEAVETKAIQTYQTNMSYFSEHQPELYKKLSLLETAIERGLYTPKYDLEYKNGYFDVYVRETDSFLYGRDTNTFAEETAKTASLKKNYQAYETVPSYSNYKGDRLKHVYPLMQYVNANAGLDTHMKKVHKYIFIGSGLGLHLSTIDRSFRPEECLLIEDDLELFKLSLFVTDYTAISKHTFVHYAVSQTTDEFAQTVTKFLNRMFFYNRFIKFFYHPGHSTVKMKFIQQMVATQSFIVFSYDLLLNKFLYPLEYINHGYRILDISRPLNSPILEEKPVLLLAAGPSLQKNIEWLKNNHGRFILVAASATLKKLYAEGIAPDIVTHIDGFDVSMAHYEGIPVETFLKNTLYLFGPFVPTQLREMLPKEKMFFFESGTFYFENFGSLATPCVGSTTLGLMLILGVRRLYLLGLDLAFDQETGSTHIDSHLQVTRFTDKDMEVQERTSLKTTVPIEGNFRDHVFTSSVLNKSVQIIYSLIPSWKNAEQTVYNLNDGAKLRDAVPTRVEEIDVGSLEVLEKTELSSALQSLFESRSALSLSRGDTDSMRRRLEHIRTIHRHVRAFKSAPHTTVESFGSALKTLASQLIMTKGREADNASLVYLYYLQYTLPLIFDLFNTRELSNPKKHIKKVSQLFGQGIEAITEQYETTLQNFLEEKTKEQ